MPKNLPHPAEPKRPRAAKVQPSVKAEATTPLKLEPAAGLAGLNVLRSALKTDAQRRERERAEAAAAAREASADADLFRREAGNVKPLNAPPRVVAPRTLPPAVPLQTQRDEQAVLHEAISDEFDPDLLLDTDDSLSYRRPGISEEVVRQMRRGKWVVQAQLDLHGLRRDEARETLGQFIREALKNELRCLRVIHGKGLGSIGKEPVLKGKVRSWLTQKEAVIAFCEARDHDGGAGAVLVLLQGATASQQPPCAPA
ncbi:Smr/MutS family protein [Paraburkholderia bonniea]|uniref:Smr/MutS family protein n=1 Tax=Paraburkholderia bonniea TaxID=2152891 RepID=UPI00257446EA|nr:Smr/MutS family protein [Paraburkholderia bonniea]WJF90929.1 Smr/MutS family protein [Paraburkholderia bonniea]WJF94243.1 Smr/MutS family protein [Paraburkholderia bonniea]